MDKTLAIAVAAAMSCIGILGDYFLKRASSANWPLATPAFLVGLVLYASTAFAWVYLMRHLKLATIGVVYSVCMILMLTAMGVPSSRSRSTATRWRGSPSRSPPSSCCPGSGERCTRPFAGR
jgi:hypothetical protein